MQTYFRDSAHTKVLKHSKTLSNPGKKVNACLCQCKSVHTAEHYTDRHIGDVTQLNICSHVDFPFLRIPLFFCFIFLNPHFPLQVMIIPLFVWWWMQIHKAKEWLSLRQNSPIKINVPRTIDPCWSHVWEQSCISLSPCINPAALESQLAMAWMADRL